MNNIEQTIIEKYLILNNDGHYKINPKYQQWKLIDNNMKNYLLNKFHYDEVTIKPSECFYLILNNLSNRPLCPICGKPIILKKFSLGYQRYCSNECKYSKSAQHEIQEKMKNTCQQRYNVNNPMQNQFIKEKSIQNNKNTLYDKYGVYSNFQIPEVREKIKNAVKEKTGFIYAFNNKEKVKNTIRSKYNADNVFQVPEIKDKINNSKKLHNTFNTSKYEKELYQLLLTLFNKDDIEQQYKSIKYPFHTDFYIKSLDLYIELQKSWTHGIQPFDEKNEKNLKILSQWLDKSEKSLYYKNAICTWTIRDVKKRNIAKQNKLNYLELFDIKDKNKIINTILSFNNESNIQIYI